MTKTSSLLPLPGRTNATLAPSTDHAGLPSGFGLLVRSALPDPSGAIEKMSSFFSVGSKRQAASLTYAIRPFAAWEPAFADPPPSTASAPASASTVRTEGLRMPLSAVTTTLIGMRPRPVRSRSGEEGLLEQVHVQADDHHRDDARGDRRHAPVDQAAHQIAFTREQHERDQSEGDPERQEYLAEDERVRRAGADREQGQRGQHRHRPPNEDRDPPPDEALHHHLAGHRPHRRGGDPRREQRDAED